MQPSQHAGARRIAAVDHAAHERLGDRKDPPRAAAEIQVVVDIGAGELAELGDANALSPFQVRA